MTTIKDLSKYTGLSVGTISNYLNKRKIKEENLRIIEEAIAELDYQPNSVGKYLREGKTKTIGVVTNTISTNFISKTYSILEDELLSNGYDVIFCNSHGDINLEANKLSFLSGRAVDFIILFPVSCTRTDISKVKTPIITVDNFLENQNCPAIIFDDFDISYEATRKLINAGHKKIACITGYEDHHTTKMRKRGFIEALNDYSISVDPDLICDASFNNEKSENIVYRLLKYKNPPTAFLVTSNEMLIGLLLAVKKAGLKIPEDISYITFDDADYYSLLDKKPSYVMQPKEELGKELFSTIYDILSGNDIDSINFVKYIKTKLVQGETVKHI